MQEEDNSQRSELQERIRQRFLEKLMNTAQGSGIFLKHKSSDESLPNFSFAKHFNKDLTKESEYFKSLNNLMTCVAKNASKGLTPQQEERVCEKEYKRMRLSAFENQLLYQQVNK